LPVPFCGYGDGERIYLPGRREIGKPVLLDGYVEHAQYPDKEEVE
jgi:hypothetical protein